MIRRTRSGAQSLDLFVYKCQQLVSIQQSLGLLIQEALVGRAASLGYELKVVGVAVLGEYVNLCWQIGARVFLVEHVQWSYL